METPDFRHPKCLATSAISSSFAFPSTGGDLMRASHVPSSFCSSRLARELGLTLIWRILDGISENVITHSRCRCGFRLIYRCLCRSPSRGLSRRLARYLSRQNSQHHLLSERRGSSSGHTGNLIPAVAVGQPLRSRWSLTDRRVATPLAWRCDRLGRGLQTPV